MIHITGPYDRDQCCGKKCIVQKKTADQQLDLQSQKNKLSGQVFLHHAAFPFAHQANISTILSMLCPRPVLAKLLMDPKVAYSVTDISV